jgi:hypothetical protein
MATYMIIPRSAGDGFDIGIVGARGERQTILGFESQADAEAWISRDRHLEESRHEDRQNLSAL